MYLDLERIGAFIQTGRKEVGLTQAKLGERLGVSAQSVSNWERGRPCPTCRCCRIWRCCSTVPWTPS